MNQSPHFTSFVLNRLCFYLPVTTTNEPATRKDGSKATENTSHTNIYTIAVPVEASKSIRNGSVATEEKTNAPRSTTLPPILPLEPQLSAPALSEDRGNHQGDRKSVV